MNYKSNPFITLSRVYTQTRKLKQNNVYVNKYKKKLYIVPSVMGTTRLEILLYFVFVYYLTMRDDKP